MTKQKRWIGVTALAGVTAVAIIAGTMIKKNMNAAPDNAIAITEDGTNAGIQEVTTLTDEAGNVTGYNVKVETVGFNSADPIVLAITFNAAADEVTSLEVVSQSETDGLGAKITEEAFLAQFAGVKLPVYLEGMAPAAEETTEAAEEETPAVEETAEDVVYTDGVYTAVGEEENGYTPEVTVTIADGKIAEVTVEAKDADGNLKSVLSEEGVYVMTENGPTWGAQAQAIADFIVENQGTSAITMDENTKTDAIASVSIKVGGYVKLANEALDRAAGKETASAKELADGTYSVEGEEENGYTPVVSLTVEGGKITAVSIDAKDADGNSKSALSEEGVYVMTENGPTWGAQAQAIADFIVENQGTDAITMDADTKTDAIASVSIKVGGYVKLVDQLIAEAAGEEVAVEETTEETTEDTAASAEGTQVDGISGATMSSKAVIAGIENARDYLLKAVIK
ncbi:MAG: FMN-binding protein [Lachnospiraceae bacterium]|nr:FMN-binding protein [Lachnospiraceae bacterium]